MPDRKTSTPWIASVLLLMLIGGYVGGYYALVFPGYWIEDAPYYGRGSEPFSHFLGVEMSRWQALFTPIHWLDRRIRPHKFIPP